LAQKLAKIRRDTLDYGVDGINGRVVAHVARSRERHATKRSHVDSKLNQQLIGKN
jgi:hypothetical protein